MSNRYEAKMKVQETALALTLHEMTDYYAYADGQAHQEYLEEQMANAAREYVAAISLSDDRPIGWDDRDNPEEILKEIRGDRPIGWDDRDNPEEILKEIRGDKPIGWDD